MLPSRPLAVCLLTVAACQSAPAPPPEPPSAPYPPAVVAELIRMGEADQEVREDAGAFLRGAAEMSPDTAALRRYVERQDSVDAANISRLKEIVREHGWPGRQAAGPEAAEAAFLIAQHATSDPAFQETYLEFLRAEYERGQVSGGAVALLTDRVRVQRGLPQLYGTQLSIQDGRLVLDPIEDEENVDERRGALGLGPLAEYLERVREAYGIQP